MNQGGMCRSRARMCVLCVSPIPASRRNGFAWLNISPLTDAKQLPFWRRPVALLFLMALAMPIAFNTWSALLNNFVIEVGGF